LAFITKLSAYKRESGLRQNKRNETVIAYGRAVVAKRLKDLDMYP
jgi:hypothetical protein